jgi:hypothetical protein
MVERELRMMLLSDEPGKNVVPSSMMAFLPLA